MPWILTVTIHCDQFDPFATLSIFYARDRLTVKKRIRDVNMNIELHGPRLSKEKKSTNQFVDYKAPRQGHKQQPTLERDPYQCCCC
jgi:hypothetical protein